MYFPHHFNLSPAQKAIFDSYNPTRILSIKGQRHRAISDTLVKFILLPDFMDAPLHVVLFSLYKWSDSNF